MEKKDNEAVVDILKRALEMEYQFIVHYPRLAKMMPNEELASKLQLLGQDSVKHANIVSSTIAALGGTVPIPAVAALPDNLDLKEFFRKQLEMEKLAFSLHSKAAESVAKELAPSFRQAAEQEREHVAITEGIIAGLG